MSEWVKGYEALSDEQKANVQRWIHLNKFIAHTLQLDEQVWFETYVGGAMQRPFDYSFMGDTIPDAAAGLGTQGESFTRGLEPGEIAGPKVPVGAQNNLGRLSPPLQAAIAGMLERGEPEQQQLQPSDVALLQKIFPTAKELAKLKRASFRGVSLGRDLASDEMVVTLDEGARELLRVNVMEFSAVMARKVG
jgi:hypothetical protein